jgi:AcrR family transcriptional regulator
MSPTDTETGERRGRGVATTSPARRPRARRGEGERLRDEILDAAEALLTESGDADKVSIRMVAERIGRTSPSIYLHFADKAALMFAVCERGFVDYDAVVRAEVAGTDDPVERLRCIARGYLRYALDQPEQFRILFLTDRSAVVGKRTLAELATTESFAMAFEALDRGTAEGTFRVDLDSQRVMLAMWAMIHGIATLLVTRPEIDWPEPLAWMEDAFDQFLLGLLARGPAVAAPKRRRATRR